MANTKKTTTDPRRNADLAMIHMAAKRMFGDVSKDGDGRDDYENWLERHTGNRSAGKLTKNQRIALIKLLRRDGMIPGKTRGGIGQARNGEERPTPAQWNRMGGLARKMGWDRGLEDTRLHGFVARTAKVSNPRFMTRSQASKVITGLEGWVRQRDENHEQGASDAVP